MPAAPVAIDETRALWFRARRSHLVTGAADPVSAAHAILGAQAQQETTALFGLSQRVASRPTVTELRGLLAAPPALLRSWGQRDTLHVYDPADWSVVVASLDQLPRSGRRGGMPPPELLEKARAFFRAAKEPVLRRDLFPLLPAAYLRELESHPAIGSIRPERLGASRLIWLLARQGEICFADKIGSEVRYASRHLLFPDLAWPKMTAEQAVRRLVRRYLSTFAPATAADMAHFLGAKVGAMKQRLAEMDSELLAVECGQRGGLVALAADAEALLTENPAGSDWPARLLPQWDGHLMTHKDKSWVVPDASEHERVWKKAGVVAASLVARGRIVATWKHRTTRTRVTVTVTPLSGWRKSLEREVKREAKALAAHLEVTKAGVVIE